MSTIHVSSTQRIEVRNGKVYSLDFWFCNLAPVHLDGQKNWHEKEHASIALAYNYLMTGEEYSFDEYCNLMHYGNTEGKI